MHARFLRTWIVTVGLLCGGLAFPLVAQEPASPTPEVVSSQLLNPVSPEEAAVAARVRAKYPTVELIGLERIETGATALYEFQTAQATGYTNATVDFVIMGGELIVGEGTSAVNLTRQRAATAGRELFDSFPRSSALKYVLGKGEREIILFSDPDCPFCHSLEAALRLQADSVNATLYVFPYPLLGLHPRARGRIEHIWCTADPAATWTAWMLRAHQAPASRLESEWALFQNATPAIAGCEASARVNDAIEMGQTLGFSQTPTLVFANGMAWPGNLSMDELQESFDVVEELMRP